MTAGAWVQSWEVRSPKPCAVWPKKKIWNDVPSPLTINWALRLESQVSLEKHFKYLAAIWKKNYSKCNVIHFGNIKQFSVKVSCIPSSVNNILATVLHAVDVENKNQEPKQICPSPYRMLYIAENILSFPPSLHQLERETNV